jgi:membrane protein YqaA with SNARE-associated domain
MRTSRVILVALAAIVLIVGPIVLSLLLKDHAWFLSGNRGYLTAIFIGVVTNLSVVIPTPAMLPLIVEIAQHNPLFWVAGVYAFGSAIGESSTYFFGRFANYIPAVATSRFHRFLENRIRGRWKTSVILVLFAAAPLPYDIGGLAAGNARYSFPQFFASTFGGKWVRYLYMVPLWAVAQQRLERVSWLSQAAPFFMVSALLLVFLFVKRRSIWTAVRQLQRSS